MRLPSLTADSAKRPSARSSKCEGATRRIETSSSCSPATTSRWVERRPRSATPRSCKSSTPLEMKSELSRVRAPARRRFRLRLDGDRRRVRDQKASMPFLEIMHAYFRGERVESLYFIVPIGVAMLAFAAVTLRAERGGFAWGLAIPLIVFGALRDRRGGRGWSPNSRAGFGDRSRIPT